MRDLDAELVPAAWADIAELAGGAMYPSERYAVAKLVGLPAQTHLLADAAHAAWPGRSVEVECDDAEQVRDAVAAGADLVLLDNLSPEQVAACVPLVRSGPRPDTPVEVSGGVTLDTVAAYVAAGADLISVGALTQSAPALDLALDLQGDR